MPRSLRRGQLLSAAASGIPLPLGKAAAPVSARENRDCPSFFGAAISNLTGRNKDGTNDDAESPRLAKRRRGGMAGGACPQRLTVGAKGSGKTSSRAYRRAGATKVLPGDAARRKPVSPEPQGEGGVRHSLPTRKEQGSGRLFPKSGRFRTASKANKVVQPRARVAGRADRFSPFRPEARETCAFFPRRFAGKAAAGRSARCLARDRVHFVHFACSWVLTFVRMTSGKRAKPQTFRRSRISLPGLK